MLPVSACLIKNVFPSIHNGTDTLIFTDIICFFLASDKMSLSVFELLQPPRSQSLVDGFCLTGAEVIGAARGWGLGGRKGSGGRDPGVNGTVCGVLCLEPCLWGAGKGGGRGDYLDGVGVSE